MTYPGRQGRWRTPALALLLVLAGLWSGQVANVYSLCLQDGRLSIKLPSDLCCLDAIVPDDCCTELEPESCHGCTDRPLLSLQGVSARDPEVRFVLLAFVALDADPGSRISAYTALPSEAPEESSTGPPPSSAVPLRC